LLLAAELYNQFSHNSQITDGALQVAYVNRWSNLLYTSGYVILGKAVTTRQSTVAETLLVRYLFNTETYQALSHMYI